MLTIAASGSRENLTVGTDTAVGTGRNNTGLLMSKMGSSSTHDDAYVSLPDGTTQYVRGASAAGATYWDYYGNKQYIVTNPVTQVSYTDWFLPSKEELCLMEKELFHNGLGNFKEENGYNTVYWSSSEADADKAVSVVFSTNSEADGWTGNTDRSVSCYVRAVRAFTDTVSSST